MDKELLKARISMNSKMFDAARVLIKDTDISDEDSLDFMEFYDEWAVGIDYVQGQIVRYEENLYRIVQSHTSQSQWIPGSPGTESLYDKVMIDEESGYENWVQPTGSHDAYSFGDIVKHNGTLWISTVQGEHTNTWEPGLYGWDEYIEN